ncbi:MAG TPA: hypothetical protein VIW73_00295 [Candidatus Cybelea sp.]
MFAACAGPAQLPAPSISLSDGGSAARSTDLLYVSDLGSNSVDYFTYPAGKALGTLTGFGSVAGVCSNKAGDVFVVDEAGPVVVYAHGGSTPIRKLTTRGAPYGCAIDPVTGNLAVTNLSALLYGTIAIYAHAKGSAKIYEDYKVGTTDFCAYDDKGNLFIDGSNLSAQFVLLELPKGGHGFHTYSLTRTVKNAGGVQWDGKYVAISDRGAGVIYRTTPTGKVAQVVRLKGGPAVDGFWLAGATLIGPNAQSGGAVGFWHYPAGGAPSKTMRVFLEPYAATVSASAGTLTPESADSADSFRR